MVCHLLTASSSSFTWLLCTSTRAHLSQVRPLLPSAQGRGLRHFLHARKPDGCVLPLELCLSEGLPCAREACFSHCWGLSPVAPHDHFCAVPHCLQRRFLPACHASCPVNCWSYYVKCIILYIVLTFAFWKKTPISLKILQNFTGGQILFISSNGCYFHTTCRRN